MSTDTLKLDINNSNLTNHQKLKLLHVMTVSAIAMASFFAAPAYAQLPDGCTGVLEAGATIDCLDAEVDPIFFTGVDDLTVNIGSDSVATSISNTSGSGVDVSGSTSVTINQTNADSTIYGSASGVRARSYDSGNVTITTEGTVSSGSSTGIAAFANDGNATVNANNVLSGGYWGIYASSQQGNTSITTTGDVEGSSVGIDGRTEDGNVTVSANNVDGGDGWGVFARTNNGSVSVTATGDVSGGRNGIVSVVTSGSTGHNTITTSGTVSGGVYFGIDAFAGNYSSGITIEAEGDVSADGQDAVRARNYGAGDTNVSVNNAYGSNSNGSGINVRNSYGGGDINITSSGTATGLNGVIANSYSDGDVNISVNNAYGSGNSWNSSGVYATNSWGSYGDVNVSASGMISGSYGVKASNYGYGNVSVDVVDVETVVDNYGNSNGTGIYAFTNGSGNTSITVAGDISAGTGIRTYSNGDLNISVSGDISANYSGVIATSNGEANIDLNNVFSGDYNTAVSVNNNGEGDTNVSVNNAYGGSSWNSAGVYANGSWGSTGDVNVSSTGTVSGTYGVNARHRGYTGDLNISVNNAYGGDSWGNAGINSYNSWGSAGDINVSASGTVSGFNGVVARNEGYGSVSVNVVDVETAGEYGNYGTGIDAYVRAGSDILITATGDVTAGTGIRTDNRGTGVTTISVNNVTGEYGDGINSRSYGTDLNISAIGAVTGSNNGIYARQLGSGATTINVNDVTGTVYDGIFVRDSSGNDINITATGTITGGDEAIEAFGYGGDINVTANNLIADQTGGFGDGVLAYNNAGIGDINITVTGDILTGDDGVTAINDGGATSVSVNNVTATGASANSAGVQVFGSGTGFSVIATGDITSDYNGIFVRNSGTGGTDISANNVTSSSLSGIYARSYSSATDISVTSIGTAASGAFDGIGVFNDGSGATSITANNANGIRYGINVRGTSGTDVSVTTSGNVTGGSDGIFARNYGSGSLSITTTGGSVSGDVNGIRAVNNANPVASLSGIALGGGSIDGENASLNSNNSAIPLMTAATGDTMISVSGVVEGGTGAAIHTETSTGVTTNIELLDGAHVSAASGIAISNDEGDSNILIDNGATVIGEISLGDGNDMLTIMGEANVSGVTLFDGGDDESSDDGFVDTLRLDGAVIDLSGDNIVNFEEIVVINSDATFNDFVWDDLNVCAGSTTLAGASALDNIDGCVFDDTIIATDDTVVSTAIRAAGGADTIMVTGNASVLRGVFGGAAGNDDSAALDSGDMITIDTTGTVARIVSGAGDDMINLLGGTVTGNVFAGDDNDVIQLAGATIIGNINASLGDDAIDLASGDATNVTGGKGNDSITLSGATLTGNIRGASGNDTVMLSGGSVVNVLGGSGEDLVVFAGSDVSGRIALGGDNDTFNYEASNIPTVIGGSGTDTLNFNMPAGVLGGTGAEGDTITEFEIYNFNSGGWTVAGLHTGLEQVNFLAGTNTLDGTIDSLTTTNGDGATLVTTDGSTVTGAFVNAGTLDVAASDSGILNVGGNFSQTSTGSLILNVNSVSDHDQILVAGTANLNGNLTVTPTQFLLGTVNLINANAINGTFATDNLQSGLLLSTIVEYDTANGDVNLTGSQVDAANVAGLTPNQIAVGNALMNDFIAGSTDAELSVLATSTGTLNDVGSLATTLEELHPEELIAGVETFRNSQMIFANSLMMHSGVQDDDRATQIASNGAAMVSDGLTDDHVWAAFQYMGTKQDGTASGVEYETDGYDLTLGVSNLGEGKVRFGAAASYGVYDSDMSGQGVDNVETKVLRLGVHARSDFNRSASGLRAHMDVVGTAGWGSNEIERNVTSRAVGLSEVQSDDPSVNGYSGLVRLTMDGSDGKDWMVRPFIQGGIDGVKQDAASLGNASAALNTDKIDANRTTFGGGATFETSLGSNGYLSLSGTGLFHSGDTDAAFNSSFAGTSGTGNNFVTVGEDIEEQYILDLSIGKLGKDNGLIFGLDGFVEFGDLEGYGGRVRLGKRF